VPYFTRMSVLPENGSVGGQMVKKVIEAYERIYNRIRKIEGFSLAQLLGFFIFCKTIL